MLFFKPVFTKLLIWIWVYASSQEWVSRFHRTWLRQNILLFIREHRKLSLHYLRKERAACSFITYLRFEPLPWISMNPSHCFSIQIQAHWCHWSGYMSHLLLFLYNIYITDEILFSPYIVKLPSRNPLNYKLYDFVYSSSTRAQDLD